MERDKACTFLNNKIKEFAGNSVKMQAYINAALKQHNIPIDLSAFILHGNMPVSETENEVVFALVEAIADKRLQMYFTDEEIQEYKVFKYKEETLEFPLIFNVKQTIQNTWRGTIGIDALIKIRRARIVIIETPDDQKDTMRFESLVSKVKDGTYRPQTICFKLQSNTKYQYDPNLELLKVFEHDQFKLDLVSGLETYKELSSLYNGREHIDFDVPLKIVL